MSKQSKKDKKLPLRSVVSDNVFMLKLIHKSTPGLIVSVLFWEACMAIVGFISNTYLLRYALNSIEVGVPFRQIAVVLLIWLTIRLGLTGLSKLYTNCYFNVKMIQVTKDIYNIVYQKAASVELSCYEDPKYYDEMAKAIEECGMRASNTVSALRDVIYFSFNLSANLMLVMMIDPVLIIFALIPLITMPLSAKTNKINYKKTMAITEENRRKDYSRRTFYLSEYAKEMRLTQMPELMLKRFRESGERIIHIIKEYGLKLAALGYIISECNEVFTTLGATLYSVWQTLATGSMGYGDCMVIVNSINDIAYALTSSSSILLNFHDNAMYIENLRKFLDHKSSITSGNQILPAEGDIILEDVSFSYGSACDKAIKHISMRFGSNEKVAIVGHNGAGKTTLVKLLLRLYDCEGSIKYGNVDIRDLSIKEYRSMFSVVMQDFHAFALTVGENVLLRRKTCGDDEIVAKAIEKSGLKDKISGYENGIDTILTREFDENGQLLSGGEQQKLAISHVYSKENRFVILDEPSSALDPIAEYEMYNHMMEACQNCGMIFISHRLSSAVMADKIYLMQDGEIIESGTHAELMNQNGRYAEMFHKQAQNYAEV